MANYANYTMFAPKNNLVREKCRAAGKGGMEAERSLAWSLRRKQLEDRLFESGGLQRRG